MRFDLTIVYNVLLYLFFSAELRVSSGKFSPSTGGSHGGHREKTRDRMQPSQAEFEAAVPYVRVLVAPPLAKCFRSETALTTPNLYRMRSPTCVWL